MERLVALEAPVLAAISGPANGHSECVLLADITIAATTTTFGDAARAFDLAHQV